MSTNYYFQVKPKVIVFGECSDELKERLVSRTRFKLHIGKRSLGWKPLFYKSEYYSSVQEIRDFYSENYGVLTIENEYGEEISMEDLEDELIYWWSEHNNKSHLQYPDNYLDNEGYEFSETDFS